MAMNYIKRELCQIEKCYSVLGIRLEQQDYLIFGGEGNGSLTAFHGRDYAEATPIWQGGGGTMSIVSIPGSDNAFLASRGFYSMVDSSTSTIELIHYDQGNFTHTPIAALPYLHRFDVLAARDGSNYLLAASIASYKENTEDWSHPGHLYVAPLPKDLNTPFSISWTELPGDYYMNHGFCKVTTPETDVGWIGCREGAFAVTPPAHPDANWSIQQILDFPVSDMAVCDVDGDGRDEIAVLTPFHGNQFHILRQTDAGYEACYTHPAINDFYHAVISGTIHGQKVFVVGARKETAELFLVHWDAEQRTFVSQRIDEGAGPSNVNLFHTPETDVLLCANRQISSAALYLFPKP